MRTLMGVVVIGFAWITTSGCSRPIPTSAGSTPAVPAASAPVPDDKRPKFESEVVHAHTINGGSGKTSYSGRREYDGKPFTVAEKCSTTLKNGSVTVKFEVEFVAHRDGKDTYKMTYSVTKDQGAGGAQSREVRYDGVRTVLVEDEYGVLTLQPPAK